MRADVVHHLAQTAFKNGRSRASSRGNPDCSAERAMGKAFVCRGHTATGTFPPGARSLPRVGLQPGTSTLLLYTGRALPFIHHPSPLPRHFSSALAGEPRRSDPFGPISNSVREKSRGESVARVLPITVDRRRLQSESRRSEFPAVHDAAVTFRLGPRRVTIYAGAGARVYARCIFL